MVSPHIIDVRWRIAADEKAARTAPLPVGGGLNWSAAKREDRWGIQAVHHATKRAYFTPVSQEEFDEVNARYRD